MKTASVSSSMLKTQIYEHKSIYKSIIYLTKLNKRKHQPPKWMNQPTILLCHTSRTELPSFIAENLGQEAAHYQN